MHKGVISAFKTKLCNQEGKSKALRATQVGLSDGQCLHFEVWKPDPGYVAGYHGLEEPSDVLSVLRSLSPNFCKGSIKISLHLQVQPM
jgi:hypothetical protein